jgi:tetratricopeptide (TPR) repeat protein
LFTFAVLLYLGCVSGIAAERPSENRMAAGAQLPYGAGGSITIMEPVGKNLQPDDAHLPSLVQNAVSGDFTRYSAMSVMNWNDLSKVMEELESMVYSGNNNFVQAGNITQTDYIMTGDLTRTGTSYVLNLVVTDAKTGMNKASYLKTVSLAELSSLAAVKAASADLLTQMGTTLAAADRTSLLQAAAARTIQAETALAKGQTAQRNGQTVAALTWYAQAADFQPGLADAEARLAVLTQQFESYDILSEVQRRFAWKKLLDEAIAYYRQHPYFNVVYCTVPEIRSTDYAKNTATLRYTLWLEPNAGYTAMLKIALALQDTEKASEWGLRNEFNTLQGMFSGGSALVPIEVELVDEHGEHLADSKRSFRVSQRLRFTPTGTSSMDAYCDAYSVTMGVDRISNGMRFANITIPSDPPGAYGPIPVVLADKTPTEYYKGKRDISVYYPCITFTFR